MELMLYMLLGYIITSYHHNIYTIAVRLRHELGPELRESTRAIELPAGHFHDLHGARHDHRDNPHGGQELP